MQQYKYNQPSWLTKLFIVNLHGRFHNEIFGHTSHVMLIDQTCCSQGLSVKEQIIDVSNSTFMITSHSADDKALS